MSTAPPEAPAAEKIPLPDLSEKTTAETLSLAPIYDSIDQRRLAILQDMSTNARPGDIATMLEIAAKYDLDPIAKEIYCARGQRQDGSPGKLLIMVSRDGLRKVARRNNLALRGDVIREKDTFTVTHRPDQEAPEISHTYSGITEKTRGPIVGAWAVVYDATSKEPMGFNVAPQVEYLPENENVRKKSAWGKTPSIMTLTAAERNALRQATPLSGLLTETDKIRVLAEGDDDSVNDPSTSAGQGALTAFIGALDLEPDLKARIHHAVFDANEIAPGSYPLSKIQLTFTGIPGDQAETEVAHIEEYSAGQRARQEKAEEEAAAEAEIQDADVVEPDAADEENRSRVEHLEGEKERLEAEIKAAQDADATEDEVRALEQALTEVLAELDARQDSLPGID